MQNMDEDMILCPYNRYHVVSKLRIQKHLIKCQKNYPNIKLATCFYNYTHRLKPEDMLKHYEICSHKIRVEGARYYEPGTYNPIDSSVNDDDRSFSFPKTAVRTQKHFYNPCKFSQDLSKKDFEFEESFGTSNSDNEGTLLNMDKENFQNADLVESEDDDNDDMKPLPLPKTVSKAFMCIKQQREGSANTKPSETSQGRGFGRAKNVLRFSPPRPQKTNNHLLPDVSDMDIVLTEKVPKFLSRNVNTSSNASVGSSMFDDTNTLRSQDIVFDDEDDDDEGADGGFILKNFDKYMKI